MTRATDIQVSPEVDMSEGRISIYTGEGHGKTPAALGIGLQRAARGERVIVIEFMKGKGVEESEFLKRLEPEFKIFRFERYDIPYDQRNAEQRQQDAESIRSGICFARKILNTMECDLLVLDEILAVVDNDICTVDELRDLVIKRGETDIVMTGITMNDEIYTFADEVTKVETTKFRKF